MRNLIAGLAQLPVHTEASRSHFLGDTKVMVMMVVVVVLVTKGLLLDVSSDDLFAHQMQTYVTRCRSRGIFIHLLGVAMTPSIFPLSQALDAGCSGPWQIS